MAVAFPAELCDLKADGFSATLPQKTRCLGNRVVLEGDPGITVTCKFNGPAEMASFMAWWIYSVNHGSDNFTMDFPFFGVQKTWNVQCNTDLKESIRLGIMRNISLDLTILDDLELVLTPADLLGSPELLYYLDTITILPDSTNTNTNMI